MDLMCYRKLITFITANQYWNESCNDIYATDYPDDALPHFDDLSDWYSPRNSYTGALHQP